MARITKELTEMFKPLYDRYVFGEGIEEYNEYCKLKDYDFGSLASLNEFDSILSQLNNPDDTILKMPLDAREDKDTLDHYQMIYYLYQEFLNFCKEKKINEKTFYSYKLFCEAGGEDFL